MRTPKIDSLEINKLCAHKNMKLRLLLHIYSFSVSLIKILFLERKKKLIKNVTLNVISICFVQKSNHMSFAHQI